MMVNGPTRRGLSVLRHQQKSRLTRAEGDATDSHGTAPEDTHV